MNRHFIFSFVVFGFATIAVAMPASAQKTQRLNSVSSEASQTTRASAAFSELILRKAELEADLEALLLDFTDEYPKVKADRYSLSQLQKQIDLLMAIKPTDASKLTLALGKLMVKKVELETDLWALQQSLADGHPDVKRAKRKVEIFDKAIKDILG